MAEMKSELVLLLFLFFSFSTACEQGQTRFSRTTVKAKDLTKLAEEVQTGASLAGLNQALRMVPSPDGKQIASIEQERVGEESLLYGIYVVSVAEGKKRKIAEVVNCFGLTWAPDGSKVAFSEGTVVHIADSDGQTRQTIYAGPGGPYPGAAFNLQWFDEGRKLSFIQVENANAVDLSNPVQVMITLGATAQE